MADLSDVAGFVPVAMSTLGMFTSMVGASQSASAARVTAERARVAAEFEAAQLEQNAGQAIAVSQAAAKEQLRQAKLVQSRAIALAAAGGGGVSDTTIMRLISRQAGEGAYRAQVALYSGEEKARQLRLAATTKRYEGELSAESSLAKANAYETSGYGAALTGASSIFAKGMGSSLFDKFGQGGYKASKGGEMDYKNTDSELPIMDAGVSSTLDLGLT